MQYIFKLKTATILAVILVLFLGVAEIALAQSAACVPFTQTITKSFSDTDTSGKSTFIDTCTCSKGVLTHGTPYGTEISHTDYTCTIGPAATSPTAPGTAEFQPIVGIPGLSTSGASWTLPEYVNKLYLLVIVIGALIGVVKISLAGVKYALSDIVTEKSDAKHDIQGVLLGLLILLVPFIVLSQIYSGLTNLDVLKLDPINPGTASGQTGTAPGTSPAPTPAPACNPNHTSQYKGPAGNTANEDAWKASCQCSGGTVTPCAATTGNVCFDCVSNTPIPAGTCSAKDKLFDITSFIIKSSSPDYANYVRGCGCVGGKPWPEDAKNGEVVACHPI